MTVCDRQKLLSAANPRLLDAVLVSDLPSFISKAFSTLNPGTRYLSNWHIAAIAYQLEEVRTGRVKRLIIDMPPRSLKSISASVAFPAFIHGHDPSKHIISATYAQDFSGKLHNDYRTIIGAEWYKRLFPKTRIDRRKDSENETSLTGRGTRLATSVGGILTGRGADIIIVDDPLKPADAMSEIKRNAVNDWYGSTLVSRLNDKTTGAIIIVTQRVHAYDLVGYLLERSPGEWTVLNLPAEALEDEVIPTGHGRQYRRKRGQLLHPDREPESALAQLRRDLGPDAYEAQYQQNPAPPGGAMFKRKWLQYYQNLPEMSEDDVVIQSWDTASKTGPSNDWSVCTTWRVVDGKYYLIDLTRDKFNYPDLKTCAIRSAIQHDPSMVLVEDTGVGVALAEELREENFNVCAITPTATKEVRASVQSDKFRGGRVLLPTRASWLAELETELLSFPGSRHDDQVDSVVQALAYEIEETGGSLLIRF